MLGRVLHELSHNETEALAWIAAHRGAHTARLAKAAARLVRDDHDRRGHPGQPAC